MWNVLHRYKILITLYCKRPFFFMSHWCVIFFLSPAPGLSSRLIYILSRRIRTSSWVWTLQAAAAVQPAERKSQRFCLNGCYFRPRDAIVPKRTSEQLPLCPFFLSPRPRRLQPEEPNFVFDLKCQHRCCDHLYSNTDLGCKASNSRRWGHLSCSSRENETALIWPLCLDKENFLEPGHALLFSYCGL